MGYWDVISVERNVGIQLIRYAAFNSTEKDRIHTIDLNAVLPPGFHYYQRACSGGKTSCDIFSLFLDKG
jgi:hypothetical protein